MYRQKRKVAALDEPTTLMSIHTARCDAGASHFTSAIDLNIIGVEMLATEAYDTRKNHTTISFSSWVDLCKMQQLIPLLLANIYTVLVYRVEMLLIFATQSLFSFYWISG